MENQNNGIRRFKLPSKPEIVSAFLSFTKLEWKVFFGFVLVLLVSTLAILQTINKSFMVEVPMGGGAFSEGIVGSPRFVNPVLATSDADLDVASLIYSGLMRKNPNGEVIPDLAEKVDVSKDGLVYTFTLKENLTFHDGEPVTADDVLFTIGEINNPIIKSPRKGSWDGINVEKIDEKTIQFTLKQPYASFLENTTLGILPAHLWKDSPIELNDHNVNPIGTGPYMVDSIDKQSDGIVNSYDLISFKKFSLGKPYIKNINLYFYKNEEDLLGAIKKGQVSQASSISPENAKILEAENYQIITSTLPRVFGLFFNQSQNTIFTNKNVVRAIDLGIDKDRIVKEVLVGYGIAIDNPIPQNILDYQKLDTQTKTTREENIEKAASILAKDGWKKNELGFLEKSTTEKKKTTTAPLEFSISTSNAPELKNAANIIKENLESLGIKVEVKTFDVGNLNQIVIRPRKYDALFFGQIINHESDLFAFWHSSQRKDPGLNVSMYTNAKVDKILEDAFITANEKDRVKKYAQFEDEVKKDMPAVFLYSPNFVYIVSKDVQGIQIDHITSPKERFLNVYLWYNKTDNVWKIFSK
ncbi:MAG: ABC transporter substrate-binding protein [Patescibacteria group bacterium]